MRSDPEQMPVFRHGKARPIVLVQPRTAVHGSFVRMLPIGLLYAASKVVQAGHPVQILDARIAPATDERDLLRMISSDTLLVGMTVMSGASLLESIRLSRAVKARYPDLPIVWGGPHPTFSPRDDLREPFVDYVVRGYGSTPFYELVRTLGGGAEALPLERIPGLSWRDGHGRTHHTDVTPSFEFIDHRDIPYQLIPDLSAYRYFDSDDIVVPLYSSMGCPYRCAFCSSPALYATMTKKWQPYPAADIVDHIAMVRGKLGATMIYFIDDDSFVDLAHVDAILEGLRERGLQIKLGFRGARVNEILAMTDAFLDKLADAGVKALHIGAETGSDRLLTLMRKGITVEQTLEANRKLARHGNITALYNFVVGYPTETLEETIQTRDLILRLMQDNPGCIILPLNRLKPLPGTELYDLAVRYGHLPPVTLAEWGRYEQESTDYEPVWLSQKHNQFIRMMYLMMYFIDGKMDKMSAGRSAKYIALRLLSRWYRPFALYRFKRGRYQFLVEDLIYRVMKRFL